MPCPSLHDPGDEMDNAIWESILFVPVPVGFAPPAINKVTFFSLAKNSKLAPLVTGAFTGYFVSHPCLFMAFMGHVNMDSNGAPAISKSPSIATMSGELNNTALGYAFWADCPVARCFK